MSLEDEIREHVEGIYFSDVKERTHWEPFEHHSVEQVEEFIETDTSHWLTFIEGRLKKDPPEPDIIDHDCEAYPLMNADPECKHEMIRQWSGVKCRKCQGWFCA